MKNRIIWFFREQRSGSTWLLLELKRQLNRESFFIKARPSYGKSSASGMQFGALDRGVEWDKAHSKTLSYLRTRPQEECDYSRILHTHLFESLENMGSYENPILLRQIRKNKTEQLISVYVAEKFTRIMNVNTEEEVKKYPTIQPFSIPLRYVELFKNKHKKIFQLWNKYASHYENETITYEDLLEGIESKYFGYLKMNQTCGNTLKLPYDKKELVTNYNQIENLLQDFGVGD
jgi:hypothetical protein